ncbi:3-isopropylmalate dehydrogenase [Rubrobacter xylanophilus DSM 9941]|uniref:3-isopropylmalate dehydrogenase n=1 Tax=Rubrobacter xylanophilus TaxID=49319 RepID=UPI001C63F121|nr:3-isopropylmalate dehydrogenase [Rubrobacter xylanophilus]QYJ16118.1 3-isopropylmalate dehydrogenase [Rubrobacter xylanophilus DSM 9941]
MSDAFEILLLPGDGIGPEVVASTTRVLDAAAGRFGLTLEYEERRIGAAAIREEGAPVSEETLRRAGEADAVLLGAVGDPEFDGGEIRPEAGLLALRRALGTFANLRPVAAVPALSGSSPLRPRVVEGVDLLIVRELTGGAYFGEKEEGEERASDLSVYTRGEVERVARVAFEAARGRGKRVASVDKANVLATSRLWRRTVEEVARDYPDVALEHVLVDAAAMHLVTNPGRFDVILTENLFGDILSDEAAVLPGSMGMLPSASLGEPGSPGIFEPVHGSAPDIAGRGVANPYATILSAAMMLRYGLGRPEAAEAIERGVEAAVEAGYRTPDLGGSSDTEEVTEAVIRRVTAEEGAA